jgi:hypothetical protein
VTLPDPVGAQVDVGIHLGAVATSRLVRDSIVDPIAVRPALAPMLGLRVATTLKGLYGIAADLSVSRSNLESHSDTGSTTLTALTLWSPSVALHMQPTSWLGLEARVGAIIYDPAETTGNLFSEGSPVAPTLGLGIALQRALGSHFAGALALQYDAHRFTTNALQTRGFTGETVVHRVAMSVTLSRRFGRATREP